MKEKLLVMVTLILFAANLVPAIAQRKSSGNKQKDVARKTSKNTADKNSEKKSGKKEESQKTESKKTEQAKRDLNRLWLEVQGRPDGKDSVYYIKGSAYSYIYGGRPRKLFNVEGYNIRRLIPTPEKDGYFVASREVVFYQHPTTGEILNQWQNPFTNQTNEVFHIANDPVNFRYRLKDRKYVAVSVDGKREFGEQPAPEKWNNYYVWHSDIFPFYSLPQLEKSYTAGEMFDFYLPQDEIYKSTPPKVMISWTRVSPWLPWMKMDNHPGTMVIHARSVRYEKWDALPENVKKAVREKYSLYQSAPFTVDPNKPNATSWTVYYDEMRKRPRIVSEK